MGSNCKNGPRAARPSTTREQAAMPARTLTHTPVLTFAHAVVRRPSSQACVRVRKAERASNMQARSRKLGEGSAPVLTTVSIDNGYYLATEFAHTQGGRVIGGNRQLLGYQPEGGFRVPARTALHIREQGPDIGMYAG